jgi:hypothetical protein
MNVILCLFCSLYEINAQVEAGSGNYAFIVFVFLRGTSVLFLIFHAKCTEGRISLNAQMCLSPILNGLRLSFV